jgi:hypothetical protein
MPEVNGIDYSAIEEISGTFKNLITEISGVQIGVAPSCNTVFFGYSDGRRNPPEASCVADFFAYEQDPNSGVLYLEGQCGVTPAPIGFYSNGAEIFFFDGSSFTLDSMCRR